jgi:TMEM175 potassium channel family protein
MVDGIFAIAMTLLVLGINPPRPSVSQAQALLAGQIFGLIPQIFIFIAAFFIIASFWLSHHRQFHFVRIVDPYLLWINIILLVSIVFIPFSTDVAGDYPEVQIAVLLFHINIMIVGFIFAYQIYYISRSGRLCDPETDKNFLQLHLRQSLLIPGVAFIAAVVSFIIPWGSLLTYLVIPIARYSFFNLIPQYGTR